MKANRISDSMETICKATISGVQGLAVDSLPDELVREIKWDMPGTILKPGSRSTVTQVDLRGKSLVIKQYKSLSLRRRLRYALTRSRARQSWETGHAMADLGIPIVRPLAFCEETRFGIPRRALLISPFQKGTSLDQYDHPEEVSSNLRAVFKKMAENKITHGDLKASNIIIDEDGQAHFIDNDAAHLHRSPKRYQKARKKDEKQFFLNWQSDPRRQEAFRDIFR